MSYCLKDVSLLLAINLSHSDSYIAVINFQAASPNSAIWGIFLAVLLPNGHCLMNTAILRREHMPFFASLAKYSSTLNREIKKNYHPTVVGLLVG